MRKREPGGKSHKRVKENPISKNLRRGNRSRAQTKGGDKGGEIEAKTEALSGACGVVNAYAKLARCDCAMGSKRSRACSLASDPTRFAGATWLALLPSGGDVMHGLELAPRVVESGAISAQK